MSRIGSKDVIICAYAPDGLSFVTAGLCLIRRNGVSLSRT